MKKGAGRTLLDFSFPPRQIWLGRETISAGPDGLITIPDGANDPRTRGIVQAGKLAAQLVLGSRASELKMDVRFYLDRNGFWIDLAAWAGKGPFLSPHFNACKTKPYGVVMAELAFYFPAVGDFAVYPLHVSEDGEILAHTEARNLSVSNDPAPVDKASWGVLASEGTNEEVLIRLRSENLRTRIGSKKRWPVSIKSIPPSSPAA